MVVFPDSVNVAMKLPDPDSGIIVLPDEKPPLSSGSSLATIVTTSTNNDTPTKEEKWWSTTIQVSVPFLIAGIGTIGAGVVLGKVQHWEVFDKISELFILVPALLGLKGNLDMCLASRLSTQANLGNMSTNKERWSLTVGNVALVQCQATVAAILVSLFAVAVGAIVHNTFEFEHAMLLCASSLVTASSACFVLDFVMIAVIIASHHFHVNPDNIATPLAASFGDVVSITVLSNIASALYSVHETHEWVLFAILGAYIIVLPLWIWMVRRNKYTKEVLLTGWVPVISALIISGFGGLVLDLVVSRFSGFVVFQPIINGIGGNLVSVQSSRVSTMLHQTSLIGILPPHTKILVSPWAALFKGTPSARTARILLAMALGGHTVFVFAADFIHASVSTITAPFVFSYLFVSVLQVMILLYIAHILIHLMWKWKIDPDNSAIPYLTSLGDLLGSGLLALAFLFLQSLGYEYTG